MKTKISALIDGELNAHEMREVCISMRHDEELRRACSTYVLIGDSLRQEPHLATEITGAVLDHLADEPVILAPQGLGGSRQEHREWYRPALALAASVAGVALVVWLGLPSQVSQSVAHLGTQKPVMMAAASDADMQEYLIAHQIHGGSFYLNDEAQHIRTVSLNEVESDR